MASSVSVAIDLWWLRPLLSPVLLLGWIGSQLVGFLIYAAVDQWGDRLDATLRQPLGHAGSVASKEVQVQLQRKKLLFRMWTGLWVVAGTGVLVALVGFGFTGTLSFVNITVALLIIAASTVILLAPMYIFVYLYHTWKWRQARSASSQ